MKNYFNISIVVLSLISPVIANIITLPEISQEIRDLANETTKSNARLSAFSATKPVIDRLTTKQVNNLAKQANQDKQQQQITVGSIVDKTINNDAWRFKQAQLIKSFNGDFDIDNQQSDNNHKTKIVSSHRLYLFVSSSMPKAKMRAYARELAKYPNTQMIMRGFIGGGKTMLPTMTYIKSIITKHEGCNGVNCKTYNTTFNIDPVLFQRYEITKVPTLVYVDNLSGGTYCSEGNADIVNANGVHRFIGLAPLKYMVSELADKTQLPTLRELTQITKITNFATLQAIGDI